jgi:hypothetical protein
MITALESLPATIAHLRTIAMPAVDHRIMPFGIPALDDRLASRGLRAGALHEVAAQSCSMVDDAAATLFLTGAAIGDRHLERDVDAAHRDTRASGFGMDQRAEQFDQRFAVQTIDLFGGYRKHALLLPSRWRPGKQ